MVALAFTLDRLDPKTVDFLLVVWILTKPPLGQLPKPGLFGLSERPELFDAEHWSSGKSGFKDCLLVTILCKPW